MEKVSKVIKYIKIIFKEPKEYTDFFITSRGVKMRNPIDRNGLWIGWTAEEVANHLGSISGGNNHSGKK